MSSLILDRETGQLSKLHGSYKFSVFYRRRFVAETVEMEFGNNDDRSVEYLYLKGLNALNTKLQTQITFGLDPVYLHVHVSLLGTCYVVNQADLATWSIPQEFLMKYIASNKISNLMITSWGLRHKSWMQNNSPPENRKFVREVGRLHLWQGPKEYLERGGIYRLKLKECECGSESPAVFQPGEIKSPQAVFFFAIVELKNRISAGISSVAYKDPSYAKLDSFMFINRLLKTNNQRVRLIIRIYCKVISEDYNISTAVFKLRHRECISEARVVAQVGGEFGEHWTMRFRGTFLEAGTLTGIILVEGGPET